MPHALLTAALLLAATGAHQEEDGGPVEGVRFGHDLLLLGDLDGDGLPELAVGAPAARLGEERARPGAVLVLSGADRRVLQEWRGEPERSCFGHALRAAGDVDGDGRDDALVGHEHGARCELRSGADGSRLRALDRSWRDVLALGDLDRDGADDLLLFLGGAAEVRSGRDDRLLRHLSLHDARSLLPAGDLDGDGLTDLLVSGEAHTLWASAAPAGEDGARPAPFPRAARRELGELWPGGASGEPGALLAAVAAGDLDGDGRTDLALSVARGEAGAVLALPGSGGAPLWRIEGAATLGHALLAPGDLDGDGAPDLVVAQPVAPFTVVIRAHSGADGVELWRASWDDGGMTVRPRLAAAPPVEEGAPPGVLVAGCDHRWHGWVQRNGFVTHLDGATGEPVWRVETDALRPPGARDPRARYR
jgi:hypothetical protein